MSNDITAIGQPSPPARPVPSAAPAAPSVPAVAQNDAGKGPAPSEKPSFEPSLNVEEMRANLRAAIERLNEMMRKNKRELTFAMDESIDRVVITVKNSQTGEIVRQIPDAAALRVAHNLESLKGLLHNESI